MYGAVGNRVPGPDDLGSRSRYPRFDKSQQWPRHARRSHTEPQTLEQVACPLRLKPPNSRGRRITGQAPR
jgi:hypothetical protein